MMPGRKVPGPVPPSPAESTGREPPVSDPLPLSVIIPVLDEAAALPRLLASLAGQTGVRLEILVVDGGSTDASRGIATAHGARVLRAPPGRASQMNRGAAAAACEWLLFLHADSRPTEPAQLRRALQAMVRTREPRAAGHFALRFERSRHGHRLLSRFMEAKSASNRRYTVNGDQGLLLHRDWLRELGGFDESLPFLEDQRMAAAVAAQGHWLLLPGRLTTSARRFETEGLHQRYLVMGLVMVMYLLDERAFFERAPGVYRVQANARRLRVLPFLALVLTLVDGRDPAARRDFRRRLGDLLLQQTWQPALLADVALPPLLGDRRPLLGLHDRLAPLLPRRLLAYPAGAALHLGVRWWVRRRRGRDPLPREDSL